MPYCNLCHTTSNQFTTYCGRLNVGCPNCNSAERQRFTGFYFKNWTKALNELNELNELNGLKVLHLAPELSLFQLFKKHNCDYISGDIEPSKYKNFNTIFVNATKMSFIDNYFDIIYASHILEHIVDDTKAINEMYRVLKPGGKLIVFIPQNCKLEKTYEDFSITKPEDRLKHYGQRDHVRIYGIDFDLRLKSAGFKVVGVICKSKLVDAKKMHLDCIEIIANDNEIEHHGFNYNDILYECSK